MSRAFVAVARSERPLTVLLKAKVILKINIFPQLKQGISQVYATVDFIWNLLCRDVRHGKQARISKWKILAHSGIRSRVLLHARQTPYPLRHGCGMPTEDAYSSEHLVMSHIGTCKCSHVETNLSWTCLVFGLLSFEHSSVLLFCFQLDDFVKKEFSLSFK